jgi:methionine biosynthesis protein MetW
MNRLKLSLRAKSPRPGNLRLVKQLKPALRTGPLRSMYLRLADSYRQFRRLYAYPSTTQVGTVNYDIYWEKKARATMGRLSAWRLQRAQVFTALVEDGDHVLDLGVGDGALLHYMAEHRQIVGYGLDISPKAVEFCRASGLNVDLADLNTPIATILKESYDYIILSEIIEHLPDPERLLNELRPFTRKGLMISIPNTGFYHHRLRLLLGRFPLQWVVTPGEHLRFWTRTDFHWWVRQLDYRIVREVAYRGSPWLRTIWPGLFAEAFVFVLRDETKFIQGRESGEQGH